jgi:hypothetical protein
MDKIDNILLFVDPKPGQYQRQYIEHILPLLNRLKSVYDDSFGSYPFEISDIQMVWNLDAKTFLRQKLSSHIVDVEINAIKLNPEKVLEMMNSNEFTTVFETVKPVIRESLRTISVDNKVVLEFSPSFFKIESGSIEIDESFLKLWVEKKSRIYTKNAVQVSIYQQLVRLRDSVNDLINIAPSIDYDRESKPFSTEYLKMYPKRLVEENYLGKMLKWNGKSFEIDYQFVLAH